jgi:uncharacterized membrane protein HdeD (DUF308 family)
MSAKENRSVFACSDQVQQEFQHLKADWLWVLLFGILLTVCGTAAVIFPALSALISISIPVVLGVALMVSGIATIVTSIWAGKWSGSLLQVLVGILYLVVGFMITDTPVQSAVVMTLFLAAFFIVVGIFRMVASLTIRFPYWGWSLLNGGITFLLGMIIYRNFQQGAIWILGLLVGLELLFHGWTWIALAMAIRQIPVKSS